MVSQSQLSVMLLFSPSYIYRSFIGTCVKVALPVWFLLSALCVYVDR